MATSRFSIFELSDEDSVICQSIPTKWLTPNKRYCFYPKVPSLKIESYVKKIQPAAAGSWEKFKVRVIACADSYKQGRQKAIHAYTSNLESETESRKRKRTSKAPKRYDSESPGSLPPTRKLKKPDYHRSGKLDKLFSSATHLGYEPSSSLFCKKDATPSNQINEKRLTKHKNQKSPCPAPSAPYVFGLAKYSGVGALSQCMSPSPTNTYSPPKTPGQSALNSLIDVAATDPVRARETEDVNLRAYSEGFEKRLVASQNLPPPSNLSKPDQTNSNIQTPTTSRSAIVSRELYQSTAPLTNFEKTVLCALSVLQDDVETLIKRAPVEVWWPPRMI